MPQWSKSGWSGRKGWDVSTSIALKVQETCPIPLCITHILNGWAVSGSVLTISIAVIPGDEALSGNVVGDLGGGGQGPSEVAEEVCASRGQSFTQRMAVPVCQVSGVSPRQGEMR